MHLEPKSARSARIPRGGRVFAKWRSYGTQAGAARGGRLSLRIGYGGKSDWLERRLVDQHEQALGSG
jgi:hypothetical protein